MAAMDARALHSRTAPARRGLSLVELLTVLGIIGLLIALLLPAVNSVRESARRMQCKSNLRQLGIALQSFLTARGRFPASIQYDEAKADYPDDITIYKPNWVVSILPFMEQQTVYDSFNMAKPLEHPSNEAARGTDLPIMLCPSEPNAEVKFGDAARKGNWARGSYGANACLGLVYNYRKSDNLLPWVLPCGGPRMPYWNDKYTRGIMGGNVAVSTRQITDGLSKTILVTELRVGLGSLDLRGTWALGLPGASSLWGHGMGKYAGPNGASGDNISICQDILDSVGEAKLKQEYMTCGPPDDPSTNKATARSVHAFGVHACMADGSVRFIGDGVETKGYQFDMVTEPLMGPDNMGVWERLNASGDGMPIDDASLDVE